MAKAHVLTTNGNSTKVAFHIAAPTGNNSAGISWADAIKNSSVKATALTSGNGQNGTITTAEANNIANGTVIEVVQSDVQIPPDVDTTGEADAFLDALHAEKVMEVHPMIQAQLKFFGYTRT